MRLDRGVDVIEELAVPRNPVGGDVLHHRLEVHQPGRALGRDFRDRPCDGREGTQGRDVFVASCDECPPRRRGLAEAEQRPPALEQQPGVLRVHGQRLIGEGPGLLVVLTLQVGGDGRLQPVDPAHDRVVQTRARLGLER